MFRNRSSLSALLAGLWLLASFIGLSAFAPVAPASVKVPILMYHHIGDANMHMPADLFYVRTADFEAQMAYLASHGYTPVSIDQIVAALDGGAPLPERPVAITFDDANQDNFDTAFPILQKHHLFATFFVVTDWVGAPGHLTWDEIAIMQKAGMLFGAHTLDHLHLPHLSHAEAIRQIRDSKAALELHLGQPVTMFAYPYGQTTPQVTKAVEAAGFIAAVGTNPNLVTQTLAERFYLPRIKIYRGLRLEAFGREIAIKR